MRGNTSRKRTIGSLLQGGIKQQIVNGKLNIAIILPFRYSDAVMVTQHSWISFRKNLNDVRRKFAYIVMFCNRHGSNKLPCCLLVEVASRSARFIFLQY